MKRREPSRVARVRADAARSYLGPANLAEEAEAHTRISSLKPHVVVVFALIGAVATFGFATSQLFSSGRIPWSLLALGIAHAAVALAGFIMWKRVRRGPGHYHVSDFIRSEAIPLVDICMVVAGRGLIWDRIHIHFKRMTRFGWSVSYVPVRPSGLFASPERDLEETSVKQRTRVRFKSCKRIEPQNRKDSYGKDNQDIA